MPDIGTILIGLALALSLFILWAACVTIWLDRPPVIYDEQTERYKSARITKQRRVSGR
jgi:hypothetical protein